MIQQLHRLCHSTFFRTGTIFGMLLLTAMDLLASDIEIIKQRLIVDALVEEGFSDRTKRFSDASASHASEYLSTLRPDGSWPDVDYHDRDNNWSPMKHLGRALALTLAYATPGSDSFRDEDLRTRLIRSIDFWYQANPTCRNWYKNDIGKQFFLQQIGLLLADELPSELFLRIINDLTAKPSMGGVNMTWLAISTLYRGVLETTRNV